MSPHACLFHAGTRRTSYWLFGQFTITAVVVRRLALSAVQPNQYPFNHCCSMFGVPSPCSRPVGTRRWYWLPVNFACPHVRIIPNYQLSITFSAALLAVRKVSPLPFHHTECWRLLVTASPVLAQFRIVAFAWRQSPVVAQVIIGISLFYYCAYQPAVAQNNQQCWFYTRERRHCCFSHTSVSNTSSTEFVNLLNRQPI